MDAVTGFFSSIPLDWLLVGGFALLFAVDVMRSGTERICALVIALPLAVLLSSVLPQALFLGGLTAELATPVLKVALFGILFAASYLLAITMEIGTNDGGLPVQAFFVGCAGAAVLVVFWLQISELSAVWNFGDSVRTVFAEQYRFWWLLGSYTVIAFSGR